MDKSCARCPSIAQCLHQALTSVGPKHRRPNPPHQSRTTTQDQPLITSTHDIHPRHSPSTSTHDDLQPPSIFQYLHHILCLPNYLPVNHFPRAQTPHLPHPSCPEHCPMSGADIFFSDLCTVSSCTSGWSSRSGRRCGSRRLSIRRW